MKSRKVEIEIQKVEIERTAWGYQIKCDKSQNPLRISKNSPLLKPLTELFARIQKEMKKQENSQMENYKNVENCAALYIDTITALLNTVESYESTCKEAQDACRQMKKAEDLWKKRKKDYQEIEKQENEYRKKIQPYMSLFHTAGDSIACFAGYGFTEPFRIISASMENELGNIRQWLKRKRELLENMEELPDKPEKLSEENTVNINILERPKLFEEPQSRDLIVRLEKLLNEFSKKNKYNKTDLEELEKICEFSEILEIKKAYETDINKNMENIKRDNKQAAKYMEMAETYMTDIQRIRSYIIAHEKEWSYYHLLKMFRPLLYKIASLSDDEVTEDEADSISRQAREIVDAFNEKSGKYRFRWISPEDEAAQNSESIRVDFIAGEASWPGLYIYEAWKPEKLICVIPGHIREIW